MATAFFSRARSMPVTAKDRDFIGKEFEAPPGLGVRENTTLTIRAVVSHNGNILYLARDDVIEETRPEFDKGESWEDARTLDSNIVEKYVRAKLFVSRAEGRKLVDAYAKAQASGGAAAESVLVRQRVARAAPPPAAVPRRSGARPAATAGVAAAAAAAAPARRRAQPTPETDDDEWDDAPSPPPRTIMLVLRAPDDDVRARPAGDPLPEPEPTATPDPTPPDPPAPPAPIADDDDAPPPPPPPALPDPVFSDSDSEEDDDVEAFLARPKWQAKMRRHLLDREEDLPPKTDTTPAGTKTKRFQHARVEGPTSGIAADADYSEFFQLFFTPAMQTLVKDQTNLYASQQILAHNNATRFDDDEQVMREWQQLDRQKLMAAVGILIFMGTLNSGAYDTYWETRLNAAKNGVAYSGSPFISEESGVTLTQFEQFVRFVHFADNSAAPDPDEPGYDKAWKIAEYLKLFNDACGKGWTVAKEVSIDEMMIAYKGRCGWKQYMPDKPNSWGLKLWGLCASKTGYMHAFELYTGRKDEAAADDGLGLASEVVLTLLKMLMLHQTINGLHVYMDNYYSSPTLFFVLAKTFCVLACGTMRCNRKGWPKQAHACGECGTTEVASPPLGQ